MFPAVFLGLACAVFAAAQSSSGPQVLQEAIAKHQAGDYKGAIEGYRQFLHEHPDVAGVRSNLGAALASEGLFEDAIREYKLALDVNPSDNRARLNLAIAYYKAADVPEAIGLPGPTPAPPRGVAGGAGLVCLMTIRSAAPGCGPWCE